MKNLPKINLRKTKGYEEVEGSNVLNIHPHGANPNIVNGIINNHMAPPEFGKKNKFP